MAIASGISVAPAVGKEAIRRRPPRSPAIAASAVLGGLQPREDPLGVADQRLPGRRQAHAPGMALQQRQPRLRLQRRDLLGDGRLRVGERLGRRRDRAAVGDLPQNLEDEPR